MRGNRWSSALPPIAPARIGSCAWPEAQTSGGVLVVSDVRAGLAREAVVLAGHGGVTAGQRMQLCA